jgi:hypothetical protein
MNLRLHDSFGPQTSFALIFEVVQYQVTILKKRYKELEYAFLIQTKIKKLLKEGNFFLTFQIVYHKYPYPPSQHIDYRYHYQNQRD